MAIAYSCVILVINFRWTNQQWQYQQVSKTPGKLSIEQYPAGKVIIPQLEPDDACQILGVQIAPDGNNQAEAQHLKAVAAEWASHMARAHLSRAEAEFSLWQVLPKLTYLLQATTFQCKAML